MALTPFSDDLDIIQKLDDEPNDVGGLTPAELKERFDRAGNLIKAFLNGTLIPELQQIADAAGGLDNIFAGITAVQNTLASSATEVPTAKAVAEAIQAAGGGDMMQATYDTDNDGKVDSAETADEAAQLSTPRTIGLTGGASGSASFDGSENVQIPVTDLDPTQLKSAVPINKGGTGGATAAAGLWALINALSTITPASTDKIPFADVSGSTAGYMTLSNLLAALATLGAYRTGGTDVAIADGGTGASTAAAARSNLGITPANIGAAAASHSHAAGDINAGTLPIARGGTGGATAAAARAALGITPANIGAMAAAKVLWTNSNASSAFPAQTLTISDLSDYTLFLITCRRNTSTTYYVNHLVYAYGSGNVRSVISETIVDESASGTGYITVRDRAVTINRGNNTVAFTDGNLNQAGGASASSAPGIMIPQRIVGWKI